MSTSSSESASVLTSLTAAREQMRLELHLLSAEARQRWDDLETKIFAIESEVSSQAEQIADKTATLALQLSDSVRTFVDEHVRNQQR